MDLRMTHGARLIFGGLVVIRSHWPARGSVHVRRMATEAQEVDVVHLEQTRIGRAMRRVAGQAALVGLYGSVFENERTHGVGVALGADRELTGRGTNLVAGLRPVRIVTVTALNEPDIDAMPVRPGEFGFLRGVASIAQRRLGLSQHEVHISGIVRTVTGRAAHAVGQVFRLGEVLRFQAGLVTTSADLRGLSWGQRFEADDFGDVAAAINVGLSRTMAALASVLAALQQRGMRSARKVLVPDFLVAGLTDVGLRILATGRAGHGSGCLGSRAAGVFLGGG